MKNLSELSLADLMGIYNNYILVYKLGAQIKLGIHYSVVWEGNGKIDQLESEINKRIKEINFNS